MLKGGNFVHTLTKQNYSCAHCPILMILVQNPNTEVVRKSHIYIFCKIINVTYITLVFIKTNALCVTINL